MLRFLLFAACMVAQSHAQTVMTCPTNNWVLYDDATCYYVETTTTQTWDAANSRCQSLGGPAARLASIYDPTVNQLITDRVTGNTDVWIGLSSCQESTSTGWYWEDKEAFSYTNWAPGQPAGGGVCGAAVVDDGSRWTEVDCSESHGVACKYTKVGGSCSGGFSRWGDNCYLVNPTLSVDHAGAVSYCTGHNADSHLVSIYNSSEQNFVDQLVSDLPSSAGQIYWIGLTLNDADLQWNWLTGAEKTFVNWATSEPLNSDATHLCTYMGGNGQWRSEPCNTPKPYVCKMSVSDGCNTGAGWVAEGSSCFYYGRGELLDQSAAYRLCKELNPRSSLASLETIAENNLVQQAFENQQYTDPWIGYAKCNNSVSETTWTWIDAGATIGRDGYSNFQNGGSGATADTCNRLNSQGQWINTPCTSGFGIACQAPAVPGTTTARTTTTAAGQTTTPMATTTTEEPVAFSVLLEEDTAITDYPFVFGIVLTNLGNGYNPDTGVFTAPVSGLYSLSAQLLTLQRTSFIFHLRRNLGEVLCKSYMGFTGFQAGCTTAVVLSSGDEIYVNTPLTTRPVARGDRYSGFSGFLVQRID